MPPKSTSRADGESGARGAASTSKVPTAKKKKVACKAHSASADSFPILPRADDDDDDLDSDATAELLEAGIQRKARMSDAPEHTHGQLSKPKETVVRGPGLELANPRELPPEDGYNVNTWIERRGGACCACCGGRICTAATITKLVLVRCCGTITLLCAAGAVVVLVWLQSRVDEFSKTMG
jgi:hypothetical protein